VLIRMMTMAYGLDDLRLWDGDRTSNYWRGNMNMRCWLRYLDCVGLGEGGDNGRRLLHGDRHRDSLGMRRHLHWNKHGGRCGDGHRWQRRCAHVR
jgi:hypothetical protein